MVCKRECNVCYGHFYIVTFVRVSQLSPQLEHDYLHQLNWPRHQPVSSNWVDHVCLYRTVLAARE